MRRKKQRQYLHSTLALNQLPTWRLKGQKRARQNPLKSGSESEHTNRKINDAEREEELQEAFQREMKRRLARTIQDCIDSGKSLADLKNLCLNKKRLDRGIVTGAEERIGARAAEIENMLRKRRKTQTPLQRWFELVESDFDHLVSDYQKEAKGKDKKVEVLSQKIEEIELIEEDEYGGSSSRAITKIQTGKTQNQLEEFSEDPTESDLNEEDNEKNRSCSASFLPLIRSDLPADIKETFLRVLDEKLTAATNYTIDFGVQVHKIINLLRTPTFVKDDNSVEIQQKRGSRLQDILPTNYQLEKNDDIFLPPPLDFSCLETANLARSFSKLFSKTHLQIIHSTYFGPQGLREGSTKTQYFHNALVGILPRNIKKAFTTDPYVMKMCLSKYATNFEVMWSNLKRPLKFMNRLLDILLKIHLAPEREQKYKAYVPSLKPWRF